jgi:Asp-tRNA(Asn)/Glu-tRNA(Gln) amidotransferase A subunit family amidase
VVSDQWRKGVIGTKPTVRVVSTDGVVPACRSYDCVTIFARTLTVANRAMHQMALGAPDRSWPGVTADPIGVNSRLGTYTRISAISPTCAVLRCRPAPRQVHSSA